MLPPTLEDLDSVNFALGVRTSTSPIISPTRPAIRSSSLSASLGRSRSPGPASTSAGCARPGDLERPRRWRPTALLFCVLPAAGGDVPGEVASDALLLRPCSIVCNPLFWFTADAAPVGHGRPRRRLGCARRLGSDLDFLPRAANQISTPTWLVVGAFLAGLSIGFRSQMAILTMPLLFWVVLTRPRVRMAAIAAAIAGVIAWAVPLIWFSGGPRRYIAALGSQAGEDFSGVEMLWTHPTPRAIVTAVLQTFVRPWDSPTLAGIMLAFAAAGIVVLLRRSPRVLAILAMTFGPYAVFHLLFQDTPAFVTRCRLSLSWRISRRS